jgi:NAD(P)-dependent dehydrogenase (short-subunit alcohol dehydrogenase family)
MSPATRKNVIVTGASRGIGRAVALACGARGWRVVVNYQRDAASAQATAREIEALGAQALLVQADVGVPADIETMFAAADEWFGAPDALVNNAGVAPPTSGFLDMDAGRWARLLEINVIGAMICAQEAARRMAVSRGGRGGSIVNISSAAARLGAPNTYVDYALTKGAIDTLTLGLGKELAADGVRVNAVRPGVIETDIHASAGDPDRIARMAPDLPMKRAGRPQEIAQAVMFLLDDASSYVTGSILDATGGR